MENTEKTGELAAFQRRLQGLAGRARLTQATIAARLGVPPSRVGMWFQGKNKPRGDIAMSLASTLGCSLEWLLNGTETAKKTDPLTIAVEEPQAEYYASAKRKRAHELLDSVFDAAAGDDSREGWILEQMRRHLDVPTYWTSEHENKPLNDRLSAAIQAGREEYRKQRSPSDPGQVSA